MIYISKILGWILLFVILALACSYSMLKKNNNNFKGRSVCLFFIKHHKLIGILSILFMFLHGKFAMQRPDLFALLSLLFTLFLLLSYVLFKKNRKIFKNVHLFLTYSLIIVMILHIIYALF